MRALCSSSISWAPLWHRLRDSSKKDDFFQDRVAVPLALGTEADWCLYLRAAGRERIRWKGKEHEMSFDIGAAAGFLVTSIVDIHNRVIAVLRARTLGAKC